MLKKLDELVGILSSDIEKETVKVNSVTFPRLSFIKE